MITHGSCNQIVKCDFGKKTRSVERTNGIKISRRFMSGVSLFLEGSFGWHNAKKFLMMKSSGGGLKIKFRTLYKFTKNVAKADHLRN